MRNASISALFLLGFLVAPALAQEKTPAKTALSPGAEVEGKTLDQWARDLVHPDPSVQEKAISVIPMYGESASYIVPMMIKRVLDSSDLGPRTKAIMALGIMDIQKEHVSQVVTTLANVLNHREEQTAAKLQAALSLTRFGDEGKPAIAGLVAGVGDTGSWQVRRASIIAIRRIGSDSKHGPDRRATYALLPALRDPAFYVRLEAVQALGFMDRPAEPTLFKRVYDALLLLTKIHDNSSVNEKVLAMWAHVSLMAIDKVTEAELKHITKHLTSPELEVRGQAVLCLGTLGLKAKSCIPDLMKLLDDKDMGIVVVTCWALVSIGDKEPKALQTMEKLATNKELDEKAREQIRQAHEALKNSKKAEFATQQEKEKKEGVKPEMKKNLKP